MYTWDNSPNALQVLKDHFTINNLSLLCIHNLFLFSSKPFHPNAVELKYEKAKVALQFSIILLTLCSHENVSFIRSSLIIAWPYSLLFSNWATDKIILCTIGKTYVSYSKLAMVFGHFGKFIPNYVLLYDLCFYPVSWWFQLFCYWVQNLPFILLQKYHLLHNWEKCITMDQNIFSDYSNLLFWRASFSVFFISLQKCLN